MDSVAIVQVTAHTSSCISTAHRGPVKIQRGEYVQQPSNFQTFMGAEHMCRNSMSPPPLLQFHTYGERDDTDVVSILRRPGRCSPHRHVPNLISASDDGHKYTIRNTIWVRYCPAFWQV